MIILSCLAQFLHAWLRIEQSRESARQKAAQKTNILREPKAWHCEGYFILGSDAGEKKKGRKKEKILINKKAYIQMCDQIKKLYKL